jgi:hypothetical protein
MKTVPHPSMFSPTILILALLAAGVIWAGLSGRRLLLLSNLKLDILLVVGLGMAICAQGGIGRVAALGIWTHPLAIVGYVLGGLILLVTLAAFTGWKLPLIDGERQALLAVTILAGLKVLNALLHTLLSRVS